MAIYQALVKLVDGRTQCLQFSSPTITGETLKLHLALKTLIPPELHRLTAGIREISDETLIDASPDGLFPSLSLAFRLRGGKGGFGSLLRGAATKAGQKKTNNFDACRDMSGRRLRHVNAEKKLEEWKAEAEDRRLEKLAEDFLKKKAKEVKKNSSGDVEKYLEKYREDSAKCMEAVEESVRESFELYKESKRKALPASGPSSKRLKWLGKKTVDESDSDEEDDDEDDGEGKSVVLDDGNNSSQNKDEEGTSAAGLLFGSNSDGEASGGDSEQSNVDEVNGNSSVGGSEHCHSSEANGNSDVGSPEMLQGSGVGDSSMESEKGIPEEVAVENVLVSSLEKVHEMNEIKLAAEKPVEPELIDKETVAQNADTSCMDEPLDFSMYSSASELEVLGMERLKSELQSRGMKCGGTLQERAARLFLLKTTPLDKLPKKMLASRSAGK